VKYLILQTFETNVDCETIEIILKRLIVIVYNHIKYLLLFYLLIINYS